MEEEILTFKMTYDSKHFKKGQRVWVNWLTGNMSAKCIGKFKKKGRWIAAWVNWGSHQRPNPKIETFQIDESFYKKIMKAEKEGADGNCSDTGEGGE